MPGQQAYVALSRLRSLEALYCSPLRMNGISNDQDVMDYSLNKASDELLKNSLHFETKNFIHNYLINSFEWSELAQEWRNHKFSYLENQKVLRNQNIQFWAKQLTAIDSLMDPSKLHSAA
jgi:hypothetical protein